MFALRVVALFLLFASASASDAVASDELRPHGTRHHMFHRHLLRHRTHEGLFKATNKPSHVTEVAPAALAAEGPPPQKETSAAPLKEDASTAAPGEVEVSTTQAVQMDATTTPAPQALPALSADPVEDKSAVTAAAKPAAEAHEDVDQVDSTVESQVADDSVNSAVMQLRQELAEVTQNRKNVQQLEQAMEADQSLLREGKALLKVSSTRSGRAAAKRQVQKSTGLLKDTMEMLHDSREAALADARDMIKEAQDVRKEADSLRAEAQDQLHLFESKKVEVPEVAPSQPDATAATEDDQDAAEPTKNVEDED